MIVLNLLFVCINWIIWMKLYMVSNKQLFEVLWVSLLEFSKLLGNFVYLSKEWIINSMDLVLVKFNGLKSSSTPITSNNCNEHRRESFKKKFEFCSIKFAISKDQWDRSRVLEQIHGQLPSFDIANPVLCWLCCWCGCCCCCGWWFWWCCW